MSKNDINNGKFDEIMSTMMTSTDARHRFHAMKLRAEDGDVGAMCGVGNCYFFGEGVIQNYAESVRWYRKAAEQGYFIANARLKSCLKRLGYDI